MPKFAKRKIHAAAVAALCAIVGLGLAFERNGAAADKAPAEAPASFAKVLEPHNKAALRATADYVQKHPNADDTELAYRWSFVTAINFELEAEILDIAEAYLKRDAAGQASRSLAERALAIGLARSGKLHDSIGVFQSHLRNADFRNSSDSVDFAIALAEFAQVQGDVAATREVYDALLNRMRLDPQVRTLCELRLSHLELAKRPAPSLGVTDLNGKPIKLADYKGKVVLVDFWGTNCGPCIEQFPGLKQLYQEFHDKGFDVVGIALDEDRASVDAFQKEWHLPWPLALSVTDRDETRDRYRADKIPSTFLVDQKGEIAYVDLHDAELRTVLEKLLGVAK